MIAKVTYVINSLKIIFYKKSTLNKNHPTDQHCRSPGWSHYDTDAFEKGFFHRLWYFYPLIYQL